MASPPSRTRAALPSIHDPVFPFLLAAAFAAGSMLGSPGPIALAAAAVIGMATSLFAGHGRHEPRTGLLLLVLFFLVGLGRSSPLTPPTDPAHIVNLIEDDTEYTLVGRITGLPRSFSDTTRLTLTVSRCIDQQDQRPAHGIVAITLARSLADTLPPPGATIAVRAVLRRRLASRNPGIVDPLVRRGIWVSGRVPSPAYVSILAPPQGSVGLLDRLRATIGDRIDTTLPPRAAGLYRALLIGDRSRLPAAVMSEFRQAGILHLLAISGLHIGMLGVFAYAVFLSLLRCNPRLLLAINAPKTATLASLVPMAAYALVAGLQPPVLRAFFMATCCAVALTIERRWSLLHGALAAALTIVVIDPRAMTGPSFQLSFAAVVGIALFYRPLASRLDELLPALPFQRPLVAGIAVSIAATIGTAPLVLYHFNRLPLYGVPATLLAAPLFCFWSLPLGLLACPLLFLAPDLGGFLLRLGGLGLEVGTGVAGYFAELPGAVVTVASPSRLEIAAAYALLVGLRYQRHHPLARYILLGSLVIIPVSVLVTVGGRYLENRPRATVLDVGHGSAVLLELPGNTNVLVDGGGLRTDRYDVGSRIIAPVLWKKRITRLDGVVITHPHADHYNGLFFILEHFRPRMLVVNGRPGPPSYEALLRQAAELDIPVVTADAGAVLYERGTVRLEVLSTGNGTGTANEDSLVLRCTADGHRFLLPGDIERRTENALAETDIRAEALLLSHHGRNRNDEFLQAVAPKIIVVSTSRRLRRRPGEYATANCGAVSLCWQADGIKAEPLDSSCR